MDLHTHLKSKEEKFHAAFELEREMHRNSLYLTSKYLLGFKDVNHHTHGRMINALENEKPKKLIVMPRGSLKSSVCSVAFPIWLLNKEPNLRILLDSELYSNSKNFLREIRLHMESSILTAFFGSYKSSTWNEGEITIKQRTKIVKEASITASGIGSEKTGQHYEVIICDDLNSPNNSNTKEGREKVINHYKYLTSILEPNGILVVVGTRYAVDDAIGNIIHHEILYAEDGK